MNVVRLTGGLGNQLFQMTAALYLQKTTGSRVWCDTSWYDVANGHRTLEVASILREDEVCRIPATLARAVYWRRNRRVRRWTLLAVYERVPDDDLLERRPRRPALLDGFFQRARYPMAMQDELRTRLTPALEPMGTDETIGVHVRLGDYASSTYVRGRLGLTAPSYFAEGIAAARAAVGSMPVRVWTDSPDLVEGFLGDAMPRNAEVAKGDDAWTALREMSRCRALVMSNSTLSWWAAFIASVLEPREMYVVMPRPWWAMPTSADVELVVPGWHQIGREIV